MVELAEQLHDIRLPALEGPALLADGLTALALGLLLAAGMSALIRLVTRGRRDHRRDMSEELTRSRNLPPDERVVAQLRLLQRLEADRSESVRSSWLPTPLSTLPMPDGLLTRLREDLYRPGTVPDVEAVDRLLDRQIRRRWG